MTIIEEVQELELTELAVQILPQVQKELELIMYEDYLREIELSPVKASKILANHCTFTFHRDGKKDEIRLNLTKKPIVKLLFEDELIEGDENKSGELIPPKVHSVSFYKKGLFNAA